MLDLKKRNNINVFGQGSRVILFAHGYGCDQNMWRFVTPAFESEYKIVLFDHVGSGNSDSSYYDFEKYNSLQGYADDIVEICDYLSLKEVIFVGHSVSSMIGMLAAIQRPDLFRHLIMIGPSACYLNDSEYIGGFSAEEIRSLSESIESNYLGWSSAITPVIMGNQDRPELTQELTNSFCRNNPDIAIHFAKVTFGGDNRKDISLLKTPTLVLQCSDDIIAPYSAGDFIYKNLEKGKLRVLKATGHCPHLSAPQETIDMMQEYLAS